MIEVDKMSRVHFERVVAREAKGILQTDGKIEGPYVDADVDMEEKITSVSISWEKPLSFDSLQESARDQRDRLANYHEWLDQDELVDSFPRIESDKLQALGNELGTGGSYSTHVSVVPDDCANPTSFLLRVQVTYSLNDRNSTSSAKQDSSLKDASF